MYILECTYGQMKKMYVSSKHRSETLGIKCRQRYLKEEAALRFQPPPQQNSSADVWAFAKLK